MNADGSWYVMSIEEAMAQGDYGEMSKVSNNPEDYADITVSEEGDQYVVKATLKENKLSEILNSTGEMMSESDQVALEALKDVKCEAVMYYEKKTKTLKKAVITMLDPIEMTDDSEGMEVGMTIKPFKMTIDVLQVGDVSVEIPQDVIDSAQPYDAMIDDFGGFDDSNGF